MTPFFKKELKEDSGNDRLVSLTSASTKVKEQLILSTISRYRKDKRVIRSSQPGFTKGKSFLSDLITFSNDMTGLVDEERGVVICLYFRKSFSTVRL